jgi:hypothetical protein
LVVAVVSHDLASLGIRAESDCLFRQLDFQCCYYFGSRFLDVWFTEEIMKITKSILCLWAGNAAFACFALYALAFHTGMACVMKNIGPGLDADLSGGYHFVLADPEVRFFGVALACGILAAASLLVSWLRNKQPFFSLPHFVALIFLLPVAVALIMATMVIA